MTDSSISRVNSSLSRSVRITILLASCLLVLVLGSIITLNQIEYFKHYPYFFDPVAYSLRDIHLYLQVSQANRLLSAVTEWFANSRSPLRTVPLILFNPELLATNVGYIATALPALLGFLIVLGWTLHRRTRSLGYSLAIMLLFCAVPGLYSLQFGLGTYWLDLPAALLVGTTAIALVNFVETDRLTWLALFSVFAACASLCRYIAIAYVLIACAPVLGLYLVRQRFWQKAFRHRLLPILGAGLIPFIVLAGYYLIAHAATNYVYYTVFGYALNRDRVQAFWAVNQFIINSFLGQPLTILLIVICLAKLLIARQNLLKQWQALFTSIWYATSIVLFLTALGSIEAFHSTMYAVPLIFFSAVSPVPTADERFQPLLKRFRPFLLAGLVLFAVFSMQKTISQNAYLSTHPDQNAQALKKLDTELAQIVVQENVGERNLSWETYFDAYAAMPTVEAFYMTKKLPQTRDLFTVHEAFWKGVYPDLDPTALSQKIYKDTNETIDLAVTFADPEWAAKLPAWTNPYSRAVAVYIATNLAQNPNWKPISTIDTQRYGKLIAYRNLSRLKSNS